MPGSAVDNETIDAIWKNCCTNMMTTVQRKISKSGEVISILYIGAAMNSNRFCTESIGGIVVDGVGGTVARFKLDSII